MGMKFIVKKTIDGVEELTKFNSGDRGEEAFSFMMKDFMKEAGVAPDKIPEVITEEFIGSDYENLESLIPNYEPFNEYGYDDGDCNSFFLSRSGSDIRWEIVAEENDDYDYDVEQFTYKVTATFYVSAENAEKAEKILREAGIINSEYCGTYDIEKEEEED